MLSRNLRTGSNSRNIRIALLLMIVGCLCAAAIVTNRNSRAATPASGTLSDANPLLTYDAGPFNVPNQSPIGLGQLDTGPRCDSTSFPCDNYELTVSLPDGYIAQHPNSGLR